MYKIWIIEDDLLIRKSMKTALETWDYQVIESDGNSEIIEYFVKEKPDLVLLDIRLPKYDGYHVCTQIRRISKVPIIFISSRDHMMDKIMAINAGGDDYIQKPFDMEYLLAKVKAMIRRTYSYRDENLLLMDYQDLILKISDATAHYDDQTVELTKNNFTIMRTLMEKPEVIVSREVLMHALWNDDQFVDDNTLTVNMNRLRKQIDALGIGHWIKTKKGKGYILSEK